MAHGHGLQRPRSALQRGLGEVAQSAEEPAVHGRALEHFPGRGALQLLPQTPTLDMPPADEELETSAPILLQLRYIYLSGQEGPALEGWG